MVGGGAILYHHPGFNSGGQFFSSVLRSILGRRGECKTIYAVIEAGCLENFTQNYQNEISKI